MLNEELLAIAVAYANDLLGRPVDIEWGRKAIETDFKKNTMASSWVWGAVVRAHYDALVKSRIP